jgi:hypothetical protein
MKIFEIRWADRDGFKNEKSWISALTPIDAIKTYLNDTNMGIYDFEDTDDIVELPRDKWDEYYIEDEKGKKSFSEWASEYPNESCIICETINYEDIDY